MNVRCVLQHLVECDLLFCIQRGLKTTRRSTSVYVKRLPVNELDESYGNDDKLLFIEKLDEFADKHPELNIDSYVQHSSKAILDASGKPTKELLAVLQLPEYASVDKCDFGLANRSSILIKTRFCFVRAVIFQTMKMDLWNLLNRLNQINVWSKVLGCGKSSCAVIKY